MPCLCGCFAYVRVVCTCRWTTAWWQTTGPTSTNTIQLCKCLVRCGSRNQKCRIRQGSLRHSSQQLTWQCRQDYPWSWLPAVSLNIIGVNLAAAELGGRQHHGYSSGMVSLACWSLGKSYHIGRRLLCSMSITLLA